MPRYVQTEDLSPQERDLQQLLQIAQLHQLMSQPDIEQQRVDETEHANRMTAAIHLLGLQQEAEQNQQKLEEATKLREASVKGNTIDAFMAHAFNDPNVPLGDKLDFVSRVGVPEAGQMVKDRHAALVANAIKVNLPAFQTLAAGKPKPEVLDAFRAGANPSKAPIPDEAWEQIKKSLPDITTPTTSGTSFATGLGKTLRVVSDPLSTLATGLHGAYEYGKTAQGPRDFWEALLGKQKPATQ